MCCEQNARAERPSFFFAVRTGVHDNLLGVRGRGGRGAHMCTVASVMCLIFYYNPPPPFPLPGCSWCSAWSDVRVRTVCENLTFVAQRAPQGYNSPPPRVYPLRLFFLLSYLVFVCGLLGRIFFGRKCCHPLTFPDTRVFPISYV